MVPNPEAPREIKSGNESSSVQKPDLDIKTPDLCNGVAMEMRQVVHDPTHSKRNLENYRKNWKHQSPQSGPSPRWQPLSPLKGFRTRQNARPLPQNVIRDYKPNQQNRNYSAMLKNKVANHTMEQKQYEHQASEKLRNDTEDIKCEKNEDTPKTPTVQPKQSSNQWISVSSRKKRKNKSADETEVSFEENDDHSEKDLFEKYDVEQLVDVIILHSQEEEEVIKVETTEEIEIGDIINTIAQSEASSASNLENTSLNLAIRSVEAIEKELMVKDVSETEKFALETDVVVNEVETVVDKASSEAPEELDVIPTEQEGVKIKTNKKSKKGSQKSTTKRVIITDVDLSMQCEVPKAPVKKIVTKLSEKTNDILKDILTSTEEKTESKIEEEVAKRDDEEERKKNKKKKKKPNKTVMASSLSSSNATINNADDSYDFLLDSALSEESTEKTNVEISQELDKIIQKGMYSSLEEKIKSLNLDDSDGFFKSVFTNISSTKSGSDKNGFSKTPDLSKILQDSRSLFRPSSVSQETNSHNKDINKILPDLDSPVEDGIFLEKTDATLTDAIQCQTATNDERIEETQNGDIQHHDKDDGMIRDEKEPKKLYPITEAVKEWLCKTRETTPDVEILKSPHAIFKEFCDSESETDTVVSDATALGDEDMTIFVKDSGLDVQDSMEYWENDTGTCATEKVSSENENDALLAENYFYKNVEQGEDVLEAFESKYGKNQDCLNLREEVKERVKNSNHNRHGNLLYRAICCSIM